MLKAVILNDTRGDFHHGCSRVMMVLEAGLRDVGFEIAARSLLRHQWWEDRAFLRALSGADAVIINGEGTLHHGRAAGADLLKVVEHRACTAPVFLVNALYQDNPEAWHGSMCALAGVWVRDSRSADELSQAGLPCDGVMLDLSLCEGALEGGDARDGIVFGDSVDKAVADRLAGLARARKATYLPSLSHLKRPKGKTAAARWLRDRYIARVERQARFAQPSLVLAKTMESYAQRLGQASLHVTGRFHGACFSILTGTPFLAVGSNSWKNEALLDDVGLSTSRLCALEDLERLVEDDWAFSKEELANMTAALARSQHAAREMFATIAARAAP
ncbi:MAG: polysaccharide pyruvyl transferase family protein [Pseudomonadota bacterium]